MRKVFSNSELPHIWAAQTQGEGRNSNKTFFFKGPTIYSYGYHFPIATFHNGTVLFTVRGYSSTTGKHIGKTRSASSQFPHIACYDPSESSKGIHYNSFRYWLNGAKEATKKLGRARKPEIYLKDLAHIKGQIVAYCGFFNIEIPSDISEHFEVLGDISLIAKIKEREEKEKANQLERIKEQLQKWLNFEGYAPKKVTQDYLRYNGEYIETSQGVKIEKDKARALWLRIVNKELKPGDPIEGTLQTYNTLKVNGSIKIGCHDFPTSYLVEFGKSIFA